MFPLNSKPGTYALILLSSSNKIISVGKLGKLKLQKGNYVYIGSALSPGGLRARIKYHNRLSTKPHWHIDYLKPFVEIKEIWYSYDTHRNEHNWANNFIKFSDALVPLNGFGASDCKCKSHLFYFNKKLSLKRFRLHLYKSYSNHKPIHSLLKFSYKVL